MSPYLTVVEYTIRWKDAKGKTVATERHRRWKDACKGMMGFLDSGAFQDAHVITVEFGNRRVRNPRYTSRRKPF